MINAYYEDRSINTWSILRQPWWLLNFLRRRNTENWRLQLVVPPPYATYGRHQKQKYLYDWRKRKKKRRNGLEKGEEVNLIRGRWRNWSSNWRPIKTIHWNKINLIAPRRKQFSQVSEDSSKRVQLNIKGPCSSVLCGNIK